MNENEPLMKYRENEQSVKTHCILVTGDKYSGHLFYWLCDWRYIGGMSSIQAYLWNRGSLVKMQREKHKQGKYLRGLIPKLYKMADYFVVVMKFL